MSECRYMHHERANTMVDCLAESLALMIEVACEREREDFPCECGEPVHDEDCPAHEMAYDSNALLAQLDELHRLASLGDDVECLRSGIRRAYDAIEGNEHACEILMGLIPDDVRGQWSREDGPTGDEKAGHR